MFGVGNKLSTYWFVIEKNRTFKNVGFFRFNRTNERTIVGSYFIEID